MSAPRLIPARLRTKPRIAAIAPLMKRPPGKHILSPPAGKRDYAVGDTIKRQHGVADAGLGDGAGHAPNHGTGLVLRQHAAAGFHQRAAAEQSVLSHPGQDHRDHAPTVKAHGRAQHRIDRRLAEVFRRSVVEVADHVLGLAGQHEMTAAWGDMRPSAQQLHALARLHGRHRSAAAQMFGEHLGEGRGHMLGDDDGLTDPPGQPA